MSTAGDGMKRILYQVMILALVLSPATAAFSQNAAAPAASPDAGSAEAAPAAPTMDIGLPGEAGGAGGNRQDADDLETLSILIEGNQGALIGSWSQARDIFKPGKGTSEKAAAGEPRETKIVDTSSGLVRMPVLLGIMIGSDKDKVAILDTDMVREGDFCQGFQVRSIKSRKVILSRDGKDYALYVKE